MYLWVEKKWGVNHQTLLVQYVAGLVLAFTTVG